MQQSTVGTRQEQQSVVASGPLSPSKSGRRGPPRHGARALRRGPDPHRRHDGLCHRRGHVDRGPNPVARRGRRGGAGRLPGPERQHGDPTTITPGSPRPRKPRSRANDVLGSSLAGFATHGEHRTVCLQLDGPAIPRQFSQQLDLGQLEHGPGRGERAITRTASVSASIFNYTLPNFQATSTATFRPRDICVILDYLRLDAFRQPAGNALLRQPVVQQPGHGGADVRPIFRGQRHHRHAGGGGRWPYGNANISITSSDGRPPIVQDFYTNSSGTPAFSAAPSSYATTPAGDVPCQEQLGNQRVLCPDRRPGAEHHQPDKLDLQLDLRNPGLCRLAHDFRHERLPGLHARAGLLGQDVLLLAARSHQ